MASTPTWKIYREGKNGEYIAATKHPEDAALLASALGAGTVIKYDHKLVVWTEGAEAFSAGESYDRAATIMVTRRNTFAEASKARAAAQAGKLRQFWIARGMLKEGE